MVRVIIVDNNFEICRDTSVALEKEGMVVDSFIDPVEAYSAFKRSLYDLAIINVRMPVVDGFDLVKSFRAQRPAVSTIMISCHFDDEDLLAGEVMHHYCDVALSKPFSMVELTAIARKLTSQPYPADVEPAGWDEQSKYR
jgi:DNA-binding response OmpR family regulator